MVFTLDCCYLILACVLTVGRGLWQNVKVVQLLRILLQVQWPHVLYIDAETNVKTCAVTRYRESFAYTRVNRDFSLEMVAWTHVDKARVNVAWGLQDSPALLSLFPSVTQHLFKPTWHRGELEIHRLKWMLRNSGSKTMRQPLVLSRKHEVKVVWQVLEGPWYVCASILDATWEAPQGLVFLWQ